MESSDTYRHWTRESLIAVLIQAEADIKEMGAKVAEFRDEAERYYQESRDSAKTLGGILRLLHDRPVDTEPRPGRPVRVEPKPVHGRDFEGGGHAIVYPKCTCGAQWLEQANRCVTQGPTALVNPIHVTRSE